MCVRCTGVYVRRQTVCATARLVVVVVVGKGLNERKHSLRIRCVRGCMQTNGRSVRARWFHIRHHTDRQPSHTHKQRALILQNACTRHRVSLVILLCVVVGLRGVAQGRGWFVESAFSCAQIEPRSRALYYSLLLLLPELLYNMRATRRRFAPSNVCTTICGSITLSACAFACARNSGE